MYKTMVSSETLRQSYVGNNSTVTPYVVPFKFLENSAIVVVVRTSAGVETTLTLDVDYTLTGAGDDAGGSFVTAVAVPASSTVIVYRHSTAKQLTDYTEGDTFPSTSHENALDRAIMLCQETRDAAEHSIRVPLSKPASSPVSLVDCLVGFDPSGVVWGKTASELLSWISLALPSGNFPQKTWLNDSERGTAVPDFVGQVGSQRDTAQTWVGTALSAGSWSKLDLIRTLANDAARTAASPHFVGQLARQTDTLRLYYGTAVSAGSWSAFAVGSPGDFLSPLENAEISITGATTATISRMHVCSGGSNYTLTLPAASGNAGKYIGIRITATSLITIDGNGAETIDGATTRVMWQGESAILQCDGSNWFKIAGKTIPMQAFARRNTAQSVASGSNVKININAEDIDIGGIADVTINNRIDIRRAGNYFVTASCAIPGLDDGEALVVFIRKNGSSLETSVSITSSIASATLMGMCSKLMVLAAGDNVELVVLHTEGSSQNTLTALDGQPSLMAIEQIVW